MEHIINMDETTIDFSASGVAEILQNVRMVLILNTNRTTDKNREK